jgi:hypothetical protein
MLFGFVELIKKQNKKFLFILRADAHKGSQVVEDNH